MKLFKCRNLTSWPGLDRGSQVLNMHVCIEYVSGKPTLSLSPPLSSSGLQFIQQPGLDCAHTLPQLERANMRDIRNRKSVDGWTSFLIFAIFFLLLLLLLKTL